MRKFFGLPRFSCVLVLGLLTLQGCGGSDEEDILPPEEPTSAPASAYSAQTLVEWFDLMYDLIRDERFAPPVASRAIGYVGVAAYEAAVNGMPLNRTLGGQLNHLSPLPPPGDGVHHWPSAMNAAVATTLRSLFAGASAATLTAIDDQEAAQNTQFATQVAPDVLARSQAFGRTIGLAIVDWSGMDGYEFYNNCTYVPPVGPGQWVPTPPAFAAPLQPCWGEIRPFALFFGAECPAPPPPPFSETPGSPFHVEATEVYDTVNALTAEQLEIARFWADNPGQTGTPPGHWVSIVGQISVPLGFQLDKVAEAYARVGVAVADAFISCWDMKYIYNLLRPITYIQSPTGLNDPAWTTPLGTPPFPEYTSGHSVQSGAAAQILTDMLGVVAFTDDTHAELGFPARSFSSFHEAADEAAISRLYGGIHFRSAIDNGIDQGVCVANVILGRVRFH